MEILELRVEVAKMSEQLNGNEAMRNSLKEMRDIEQNVRELKVSVNEFNLEEAEEPSYTPPHSN